jgi:uncharacterized protein YndB with AHSA1/START domain
VPAGGNHELEIVRIIAATPEEIFDAWTDAKSVEQWMLPGDIERSPAQMDPRVGGRFRIDMISRGKTYPHSGEYLRMERPRLIEFTWISEGTNQQRSVVTIELTPKGASTELRLKHRMLPSEDAAGRHRRGWTDIVNELARALEGAAAGRTTG